MALSRTWYTDANLAVSDFSTAVLLSKSELWGIKALLKGEVSGTNGPEGAPPVGSKWTCESSSDGAGNFAMDGTDLWTNAFDATKINRASGAANHSWIVLKSPNALGPIYMLIDWNTTTDATCIFRFSYNPFSTGGSATAAPTSTNSWAHSPDGSATVSMTINDGTASNHKLHRVTDADGNFWLWTSKNGSGLYHTLIGVQTLIETRTGETRPTFSFYHNRSTDRGAGSATTNDSVSGGIFAGGTRSGSNTNCIVVGGRLYDDSGQFNGGLIVPALGGQNTGVASVFRSDATNQSWTAQANATDSNWDFFPVWVFGVTSLKGGVRGRIPDASWCMNGTTVGAGAPSAASQERVVAGNFILPKSVVPSL